MKETIGWILCIIGCICGLRVFAISARHRNPSDGPLDEFEHHKRLSQIPGFGLLVFVGLACSLLGMYLIGMFGR